VTLQSLTSRRSRYSVTLQSLTPGRSRYSLALHTHSPDTISFVSAKKIITVPHPHLRQVAEPITQVNSAVKDFVQALGDTLVVQKNPAAAGLALPQIDIMFRGFATYLENFDSETPQTRIFLNPVIVDKSDKLSTGPDHSHPDLEGCLSIPLFYGPVLRPEWVTFEYQLLEGNTLSDPKRETFYDFAGRVMQHELDHLNGILFTDYIREQGQPLYRSEKSKLIPVDPILIDALE
jgi:peptide deformylase